jgi:DNA-binding transcriptional LysR family regulator
MGVDPHLLRTFVTVARLGSFSAAARELGYTQSAVSQQVATLESDLGTPLLTRRPVLPTEAGGRLLEHAGPILLRLDAARADVARVAGDPPDRLVLGASALAMTRPVAGALAALRRERPRLDVVVAVAGRNEVVAGVAAGRYDLGLVDGITAPNDPLRLPDAGALTAVGVAERPLVVALPAGHPLADRAGLALAALADARWLDAPELAVPAPVLRDSASGGGWRAAVRYEGADCAGLLALVAAGHGIALLPADLAYGPEVTGVPLTSPRLVHRVELVHGRLVAGPAAWLAAHLSDLRPTEVSDASRPRQ